MGSSGPSASQMSSKSRKVWSQPLPGPPLPFTGPRSSATEEKKTLAKNKPANGSSQALCGHLKIERIQALLSFFFPFITKINGKWKVNELGQEQGRMASWGESYTWANKARPLGAMVFFKI